jgi:hypothetical protein
MWVFWLTFYRVMFTRNHNCFFFPDILVVLIASISIQISDVKKNIETVQGVDVYPAAQQMLIHQGKVLKDGTTLDENKVVENSFIVIMLSKVNLFFYPFQKLH